MRGKPDLRLFLGSLLIAFVLVAVHEWYFRTQEYWEPGYDDESPDLWARERAKVDRLTDEDVVIIGSSRIHFNSNLDVWESETGRRPVMLAVPGSSPYYLVEEIVENTDFRGLLLVGVSTEAFFTVGSGRGAQKIKNDFIGYYYDQTYAQKFSQWVYGFIDPHLAYLDPDINLDALIDRLPFPDRERVWHWVIWPCIVVTAEDRGGRMASRLEYDTVIQNRQKEIWLQLGAGSGNRYRDSIEVTFSHYVPLFKKLREKGGRAAFVSSPVSGAYLDNHLEHYPREEYWDRLLRETQCPGYHFSDYPETKDMQPPEWSHLTRKDADIFTMKIIQLLREDDQL